MPFNDGTEVVVERTDGVGPPRRGWLGGGGGPAGGAGDRLAGVVWCLSRHGRYGRAVMLHQHVRERWAAGPGARRGPRSLVGRARRLDAVAVRRRTVWVAISWATLTRRLAGDRPGREAVVGAVAAPLVVPAVALAAVALAVLLVADMGLWTLSTVGGTVRTAVVPSEDHAA